MHFPPTDCDLAVDTRTNLLIAAPRDSAGELVERLRPFLHDPVVTIQGGEPLRLPSAAVAGTVIILDVDAVSAADQRRLFLWLATVQGRVQVISTASTPLLPLVSSGHFFVSLYYRLNVIYVELPISRMH